jgi:hydroxymethylpyrimidine/phosphomethylpyrimidine kinase
VPPDFVASQIHSVLTDLDVRAIKIGMLSSAAIIEAVAQALKPYGHIPFVLDPVMVAASGDVLLDPDAISALREHLLPIATVVTPNLPEASALTGDPIAIGDDAIIAQGRAIVATGVRAVLMKGGHATGPESIDFLVTADQVIAYRAPRIQTQDVHGTGCTLSSAIAAGMAKGLPLQQAIAEAKTYVSAAIAAASDLQIGKGRGPAHHFHGLWLDGK